MEDDVRNSSHGARIIPLVRPTIGQVAGNPTMPACLLERVRESLRARHYSARAEKASVGWT
jgi:hypothetical protein